MADFIKVTEIVEMTREPYEYDAERWISKYHITEMEDDKAHNQSLLTYDGREMKIRESVEQIIALCKE